jgi:phosphoribosyl-ATP pyrophosphohydrolase
MPASDVIERIESVIRDRLRERPAGSYVTRLLDGGEPAIAAKIREEAAELCAAARGTESVHEAADVLFHVLVLLGVRGVEFGAVCAELERRFGTSGLAEKAARSPR